MCLNGVRGNVAGLVGQCAGLRYISSRLESFFKGTCASDATEILGVVAMFGFLNRWRDIMATPLEATLEAVAQLRWAGVDGRRVNTVQFDGVVLDRYFISSSYRNNVLGYKAI